MIFAPARLGSVTLDNETLAADKKGCRRFGPCGVGEKALYLNSFFIDRHYYVALSSVRRVFKRVAMSKGGFTGKGPSAPSLPGGGVRRRRKAVQFQARGGCGQSAGLSLQALPGPAAAKPQGGAAHGPAAGRKRPPLPQGADASGPGRRERLEQARAFLEDRTSLTRRLSQAAKAKRVNDRSNPSYKWVALAIVIAGLIALVYGVVSMIRGANSVGIYFALFGLAAVFLFSGAHVLPTARNNKTALTREWEQAQADLAAVLPKDFPLPARYAHPVVLTRMIRVLREGRAQTADEALDVVKRDLKALTADVQVEQWEYDEVVAVKPMFLLSDYQ
ncbi:MAG: ATPase P [Oscillospiraceae bacterium]